MDEWPATDDDVGLMEAAEDRAENHRKCRRKPEWFSMCDSDVEDSFTPSGCASVTPSAPESCASIQYDLSSCHKPLQLRLDALLPEQPQCSQANQWVFVIPGPLGSSFGLPSSSSDAVRKTPAEHIANPSKKKSRPGKRMRDKEKRRRERAPAVGHCTQQQGDAVLARDFSIRVSVATSIQQPVLNHTPAIQVHANSCDDVSSSSMAHPYMLMAKADPGTRRHRVFTIACSLIIIVLVVVAMLK